jgi:hypothetical protein
MRYMEPAPPEFFEGQWKVTERIYSDKVDAMTEEVFALLTPSSDPSEGIVFHLKLTGENDRSLELVGINYDEVKGKIDGLGHDLEANSVGEVTIWKMGDAKIEMSLPNPSPSSSRLLSGTFGAEKAGGS